MLQWCSTFPLKRVPQIEEVFGSKETFVDAILTAMVEGKSKLPEMGIMGEELEKRQSDSEKEEEVTGPNGEKMKIKKEPTSNSEGSVTADIIIMDIDPVESE